MHTCVWTQLFEAGLSTAPCVIAMVHQASAAHAPGSHSFVPGCANSLRHALAGYPLYVQVSCVDPSV